MKIETAADVEFLIGVHFASAALAAALERGLFWRFNSHPQSVEALAGSLGMSPGICRNWLRMLASLGLLEEADGGYALSAAAQTAVLQGHDAAIWSELAVEERKRWPGDLALVDQLFTTGPVDRPAESSAGQLSDYVQDMAADPKRAYQFTHMLYDLHRPLAEDVARQLDLTGAARLLDIGGGSGVVSLALLRKYPELTATVVDIANVCAVGRQIADSTPEAGRITYYPANFRLDDFPGRFDLIMSCDIMGYDQKLVKKIAANLEVGGRFVIVDRWFEEPREWTIWHSSYLLRRSLREPDFSMPSITQLYSRLRSAGLEPVSREEIPYGRWQMIQARKNA
jgi:SAM-dependent methyltransferase